MTVRWGVLRAAAADIREHGLSQTGFQDDEGRRCTVGALVVAGGGSLALSFGGSQGLSASIDVVLPEIELVAQMAGLSAMVDGDPDEPDFGERLRNALLCAVYRWSDCQATAEQVAALLDRAADHAEAKQLEADLFDGELVVIP